MNFPLLKDSEVFVRDTLSSISGLSMVGDLMILEPSDTGIINPLIQALLIAIAKGSC